MTTIRHPAIGSRSGGEAVGVDWCNILKGPGGVWTRVVNPTWKQSKTRLLALLVEEERCMEVAWDTQEVEEGQYPAMPAVALWEFWRHESTCENLVLESWFVDINCLEIIRYPYMQIASWKWCPHKNEIINKVSKPENQAYEYAIVCVPSMLLL